MDNGKISYAGMFEVRAEGVSGCALCVNSDELQVISDTIMEAGFPGKPMDVTHIMDLYQGPPTEARLARMAEFMDDWIAVLVRLPHE